MTDRPAVPFADILGTLSRQEAQHADALDQAEGAFLQVIERVTELWRKWWQHPRSRTAELQIDSKLGQKFLVCFPLAAHALNHVAMGAQARDVTPWVAKSCTRIAFEHALTAQWVMLTENGETKLHARTTRSDHVRLKSFVEAVRDLSAADSNFAAGHGLTDDQLQMLVDAAPPPPPDDFPNLEGLCRRFAGGPMANVFYDIQRDLSQAVHPSNGLLLAHLLRNAEGKLIGVDWAGSQAAMDGLARTLALSGLWALYILELCRHGQPHVDEVIKTGPIGLPIDLRASDQHPEQQPVSQRYW